MIKFTLPNFYEAYKINEFIIKKVKENPEKLKFPIVINQVYGSLPFSIWNGGINSNIYGNILMNHEIIDYFQKSFTCTRLDFGNTFIQEEDTFNNYGRIILEKSNNGSTAIELTSLKLYDMIKNNYKYFNNFILSSNAFCLNGFNIDIINALLENEDFKLISIPSWLSKDFELLDKIEQKEKIEVCINPLCPYSCNKQCECNQIENQYQYDFSKKSVYQQCPLRHQYLDNPQIINIEEIKDIYLAKGITNFKIAQSLPYQINHEYILFLIKYFFKKEFQQELIQEYLLLK